MITHHEIQIRVRYQETDAQGHVHHANYLTYFEAGRTELLRAAGFSYREFEQSGRMLVVAEANCRYISPARYDDLLTLRTETLRAKGARIFHRYEVRRDGELLVEGTTTLACITPAGKVARLPDFLQYDPDETSDTSTPFSTH
jgi:acyl-CoA thioester hydrolase